jgi:cobalt-zinc-cadmium efflux system outer membrane protein
VAAQPAPPAEASAPATGLGLSDLVRLSLERHPALAQAGLDVAAAQGRAVQAGLYPNPVVSIRGDEIGRRGGIYTWPEVSQEIVTADKLGLGRAVGQKEVDQATLALLRQRYLLLTTVRQGYFELLALRRRLQVLTDLALVQAQAYENYRKLQEAKQISELDLLQFRIELGKARAEQAAAERELAAAWPRLTAAMGVPGLPPQPLAGSLDLPLPDYELAQARAAVLAVHPEVRSAQVGVSRARLALDRELANRVPNVTVAGGYTRDFNDREHQGMFAVSVPVPLFNRNEGNIEAAQAALGHAVQEVARVQNDLVNRLATAFGQYDAARQRAERYRTSILPDARRAYRLAQEAFRGGQFDSLKVLQAQRAISEAEQEYVKALGDAWQGAGAIAGLLLQEEWPASDTGPVVLPCPRLLLGPPEPIDEPGR